ncbi:MAG TPA: VOC family protein [Terriglobales bacterium]|nr:VOC family protein [Terriglobales bacterium]
MPGSNRSVPADILVPHIVYRDVAEAIEWLTRAFGFVEHFRYGDADHPNGAQMRYRDAVFMIAEVRPGRATPADSGVYSQSLTVFIDDVDGHHARAKAAGARIFEEPHETEYGEYQYGAVDFAGHRWIFSRHARDLSPEQWGATLAKRRDS